ncbi:hypothetical protein ACLB2K_004538 [Fragaria x ananassa]
MQGEQDQPQQHNNQDGKVNQQQQHGQQQHHEPQKCPRCESHNTKFPATFARRVGGTGPRVGTSEMFLSVGVVGKASVPRPCPPHQPLARCLSTAPASTRPPSEVIDDVIRAISYPELSTWLPTLSSQLGIGGGASNNLGLLHGFNAIPSYGQRHMQSQLFRSNTEPSTLFPSKDDRGMLLTPTRSSGVMTDWPESFISKSHASATNVAVSTGQNALWSTTIGNNTGTTSSADPSINSTQWSDDLAGSFAPGPPQ